MYDFRTKICMEDLLQNVDVSSFEKQPRPKKLDSSDDLLRNCWRRILSYSIRAMDSTMTTTMFHVMFKNVLVVFSIDR